VVAGVFFLFFFIGIVVFWIFRGLGLIEAALRSHRLCAR